MAEDKAKADLQNEIMCRVLASSVVSQLAQAGCEGGQMINFASEVMRSIIDKGFNGGDEHSSTQADKQVSRICMTIDTDHAGNETVRGERLVLRRLRDDDAAVLGEWLKDTEIQASSSKMLLELLLNTDVRHDAASRYFVIEWPAGGPVGLVCLFNVDASVKQAEMAKLLGNSTARGKGLAKEATLLLMGYAFECMKLSRIYLRTHGFNMHNIKLNERLGFKFEGILRNAEVFDGKPVDVVIMSMLVQEFFKLYKLNRND